MSDIPDINRLTELGQKVIETITVDDIVEIQIAAELPPPPPPPEPDKWYCVSVNAYWDPELSGCEGYFLGEKKCCIPGEFLIEWLSMGYECQNDFALCLSVIREAQSLNSVSGPYDTADECMANCDIEGYGVTGTETLQDGIIQPNREIIQPFPRNDKEYNKDRFKRNYAVAVDLAKDSGRAIISEAAFVSRRQECVICLPEDKAGCSCVGCKRWNELVFKDMKCPKDKWPKVNDSDG